MTEFLTKFIITFFFGLINNSHENRYLNFNNNCSFAIDYTKDVFLKDGEEFHYISGSFHYFRCPRAYWRDRLRTMKQAGLNCVCTYIEWSTHAPSPHTYYFADDADIEHFIQLAAEEKLSVILRVGPYICAERDFGGFPPWLLTLYPNIRLRTNDTDYQYEVKKWFNVLFKRLFEYLRGNCGPVILIQIENEYGSFFECNMEYKLWLRDLVRSYVLDKAVLFTTDGPELYMLECGHIPEVYTTIDFGTNVNPRKAFANMRKYSPRGPLVNSEFYPGRLNHWNERKSHIRTAGIINAMKELFELRANFNFYMFFGGTSFAFKNGANYPYYKPQVTSYDFDAPMTEAGDPRRFKYFPIRDLIFQQLSSKESYYKIPDKSAPRTIRPKGNYGKVTFAAVLSIFNISHVKDKITFVSRKPKTFEELKLWYGYMLYETIIPNNISDPAILEVADLRDRAIVYMDDKPAGILSRARGIYRIPLLTPPGRKLTLLCENQGRINFGNFTRDFKGLISVPQLNNLSLYNWTMIGLPFEDISWIYKLPVSTGEIDPPALYIAELILPRVSRPMDTFIDPTGWGKGVIFVNECNLGRYWPEVGPQVTLYVPAICLRAYPQKNKVVVFETEYTPSIKKTMSFVNKPFLNKMPPYNGYSVYYSHRT